MWTRQRRRKNLSWMIIPVVTIVTSAYFYHHSSEGRFGSTSRAILTVELSKAQSMLAELKGRRNGLEKEVALLRDGTIERDSLDERARASLGMVGKHEVIMLR